jgi:hypothetical protein
MKYNFCHYALIESPSQIDSKNIVLKILVNDSVEKPKKIIFSSSGVISGLVNCLKNEKSKISGNFKFYGLKIV